MRDHQGTLHPTGDKNEILLLQKMEKWLREYHKDKIDGQARISNLRLWFLLLLKV